MTDGGDDSLDDIVLIFQIIDGTEDIVNDFADNPDNQKYRFTPPDSDHDPDELWKGGQSSISKAPLFCLRFGQNVFSPTGWVAGSSDSDDCDLKLTQDNMSGISRKHFQIDINIISRCPRIRLLSSNPMRISGDGGNLDLVKSQLTNIVAPVTVNMGVLQVRVWPPNLTKNGKRRYDKHVEQFRNDLKDAEPVHPASHMAETADVKFGLSGAVYKRVDGYSSGGSFGSVFKVIDMGTRTEFAAKVLHYKASDGPDLNWKRRQLLREELDSLVKLKHPHIVEAFELVPVHDPEPPWLIMEWIPDNLRSLLPLEDAEKPIILGDVSAGLAFMHLSGFAHRDLKPENVLIGWNESMNRNVAKITDVGVSKYHAASHMCSFVGSPVYAAPEIFQAERRYTKTVDLWSLGMMALELLVECDLTTEGSNFAFQTWVAEAVWPRLASAPTQFSPLLEGLLRENPTERWTASEAEVWLTKYTRPDGSDVNDSGWESSDRGSFQRSGHPSLSTRPGPVDTNSLPDTEVWGSPI